LNILSPCCIVFIHKLDTVNLCFILVCQHGLCQYSPILFSVIMLHLHAMGISSHTKFSYKIMGEVFILFHVSLLTALLFMFSSGEGVVVGGMDHYLIFITELEILHLLNTSSCIQDHECLYTKILLQCIAPYIKNVRK
jgi:hypothetical protein